MSHPVTDIFQRAADLSAADPRRRGNTVWMGDGVELVVSGDLHGQRDWLAKIIDFADIGAHPNRVLILQELIHGPVDAKTGKDRSVELLLRAARLKLAHPEQVIFLLGNHDLAQITGGEVSKDGRSMCRQFAEDVVASFGDAGQDVLVAVLAFLRALPIAVRCANGAFVAHSAPAPERMDAAGTDILDRQSTDDDLLRGGPVYDWTWGRHQTAEQMEALGEQLGVSFFVLAHRHVDSGYEPVGERAATITSDNPHGCVARFATDQPLTAETFADAVRPIATLRRAT